MIFLPIVGRELRLATRRPRTYWVRSCAAAVAVGIGGWMLMTIKSWQAGASVGRSLFDTLSTLAFGLCLSAGIFTTSVSLSEEKQSGTLGLLFLTDLTGHDVVLGKLATISLNTVQTLVGIFPVLAVSLILGGVSSGEFWRMALTLSNTLFFSLAGGLFVSAISRRAGKAMAGTALLVGLITLGLAVLDRFLFGELKFVGADYYLLPGPFQAFSLVADDKFALPLNSYGWATLFTFWLGLTFLALAGLILPRTCQDKSYARQADTRRERWSRWATGEAADFKVFRVCLLRVNPAFWLASRHRWRWFYVWALIGLAVIAWLLGFQYFGSSGGAHSLAVFLCLTPALHAILKVSIASEASSRLAEARRNGELELLLVTPLSVRRICQGHLLALKRQFIGPVILVGLIDLTLMFLSGKLSDRKVSDELTLWLLIWAMLVMLLVDAQTLAWVGLWQGLRSKSSLAALRSTLLRILMLPWLVFLMSLYLSPTFYLYGVVLDSSSGWFLGAVIWWWIIGFMVNTIFQLTSKRALYDQFRSVAAYQTAPKEPNSVFQRPIHRKRHMPLVSR